MGRETVTVKENDVVERVVQMRRSSTSWRCTSSQSGTIEGIRKKETH